MDRLDIIVPVRNEEKNVIPLTRRITKSMQSRGDLKYSIIFVLDPSTDKTLKKILQLKKTNKNVHLHIKEGKPGKAYSILEAGRKSEAQYLAMIDGDLQYPPEVIPEMFDIAREKGVAVARRKSHENGFIRNTVSNINTFLFGKVVLGLDCDVQSGLKVFPRELLDHLDYKHIKPWALDMPLLKVATELGYSIGEVEIDFAKRVEGSSKVNILFTSIQIMLTALRLKFLQNQVFVHANGTDNPLGHGISYKKKKFITHTKLPHEISAVITFTGGQKAFISLLLISLITGLLLFPHKTILTFVALLTFVYFSDMIFSLYVLLKSMHFPPEIKISKKQLGHLKEEALPFYTILVPMYKEGEVIAELVKNISKIDWPKDKLDVLLLLEEDDDQTLNAAKKIDLPDFVKVLVVPHSMPKTKPKACNYGLAHAKGEYVVIYDAEDKPDPLQLKKVYSAFKKLPENVVCLQSKLNYFNPDQNWLTRLFTAEYSLWFDIILPGLQSIESTIPLGGTSNHFKTKILRELHGWDPFNVTEDCDLGARLFKKGYKTAIIDSTTWEEANSNVKNWLRQRSRWIKGYLQTYLVHMRDPFVFFRTHGVHAFTFQLVIGMRISFMLINPALWIMTIAYFTAYSIVGPTIESLYPAWIFYFAIASLVVGNFIYFYNYMIGCAKRGHYALIKYVFLIPVYWIMNSIAAFIAFYQLIVKPHYWEKTKHGLHLQKNLSFVKRVKNLLSENIGGVLRPVDISKTSLSLSFGTNRPKVGKNIRHQSYVRISNIYVFLILVSDIILAQLILEPTAAEQYAILSLAGKSIFIFASLLSKILSKPIRVNFKSIPDREVLEFYSNLLLVAAFSYTGFFIADVLANRLEAGRLGSNFFTQLLPEYALGVASITIASAVVYYHQRLKHAAFSMFLLVFGITQVLLTVRYGSTVSDISYITSFSGIILLILVLTMHIIFLYLNKWSHWSQKMTKGQDLRILVFNWRDKKHIWSGGSEEYIHQMAKNWVAEGNKVTLFCGSDRRSLRNEKLDGVEIVRRGGFYTVYLWAFLYYILKFRGKYDLIVESANGLPFFTVLYSRVKKVLVIHHVHQDVFMRHLYFPLNYFARFLESKIMPFLYKNTQVVTISNSSRNDISKKLKFDKENIAIVRPGVEHSNLGRMKKSKNPSFSYVGRHKDYKNIDLAIRAFARVAKKHPKAVFNIAGEGESTKKLKELATSLGVEKKVNFLGRVSEKEKKRVFASSWAAIQPSSFEGWGITVIEANACGTPVIAANVSGLKDSVLQGETGILFKDRSLTGLVKAMHRMIENKDLRSRLSENAYEWAQNFEWQANSQEMIELVRRRYFGEIELATA